MAYKVLPREISYLKRTYYAGDTIEPATELDARRLQLVGKIGLVDDAAPKRPRKMSMARPPKRAPKAEAAKPDIVKADDETAPPSPPPPAAPSEPAPASRSGHYLNRRLKTDD